jgi:predicted DCC family thiol-disulfide oxidoreductase YuxK
VRFVAKRECSGQVHFAPLGGAAFQRLIPESMRSGLPDSLLVRGPDGALLCRSAALIHLLGRMGPGWRLAGTLLGWVPKGLRDWSYDWLARRRRRSSSCAWRPDPADPRFEA